MSLGIILIIYNYIRREFAYTVIAITCILILIAMSNQIAVILGKAVHGELAKNAVLYIVAFSLPYFLAILIPIGVFIAVYLVFTRLYSEQEIVILKMSGFSNFDLIKIVSVPLIFITLFASFANLWLVPTVLRYRDILMDKAEVIDAVTMLASGHFQTIAGGKYVVYVQDVDSHSKKFQNIFIAQRPNMQSDGQKQDRWDIFISKEGYEKSFSEFGDKRFIVMNNGYQYQGIPGEKDFYKMQFEDYGFETPTQNFKGKLRRRAKSTPELWASFDMFDRAELQARINLIVAPIVLALVALALSSLKPRQSRFSMIFPAVIIVLIYYNLLLASEDWLAKGIIPMFIGGWWLHLSLGALASYLILRER